jgi:hypothetical protein
VGNILEFHLWRGKGTLRYLYILLPKSNSFPEIKSRNSE